MICGQTRFSRRCAHRKNVRAGTREAGFFFILCCCVNQRSGAITALCHGSQGAKVGVVVVNDLDVPMGVASGRARA